MSRRRTRMSTVCHLALFLAYLVAASAYLGLVYSERASNTEEQSASLMGPSAPEATGLN